MGNHLNEREKALAVRKNFTKTKKVVHSPQSRSLRPGTREALKRKESVQSQPQWKGENAEILRGGKIPHVIIGDTTRHLEVLGSLLSIGKVSPMEFALSIDLVFEQILGSLDTTSLFNCRLVSHKWRSVSTKIIKRKGTCLEFKYSPKYVSYIKRQAHNNNAIATPMRPMLLQDLTRFIRKTYVNKAGTFSMDTFPCSNLIFQTGSLSNPQLQSFLSAYGLNIRNLILDFSASSRIQTESVLMKQIENLLSAQAVNLLTLSLTANLKTTGEEGTGSRQPEPIKRRQTNNALNSLYFEVPSRQMLDQIISISPNLHHLNVGCSQLHFLVKPLDRLHLLRGFHIHTDPTNDNFDFNRFRMVEAAISSISPPERQAQNLLPVKLTKLHIDFGGIIGYISEDANLRLCFVRVINKILECSWDTLDSISLRNHTKDIVKGIRWPSVLPKLETLVLCPTDSCGLEIFPSVNNSNGTNFKMQDTFPKIKSIKFDLTTVEYSKNTHDLEFVRTCNFGPVPSVKYVNVNIRMKHNMSPPPDDSVNEKVTQLHNYFVDLVRKLFPNAEWRLRYIHSL